KQDRAGVPSISTVQAPQTPCSQPARAPVSRNCSRRQSSRLKRGSTSTARVSPLTLNSTRIGASALGRTGGIGDRAHGEGRRDAPAIFGGGMEGGGRLDGGERGAHRFPHAGLVDARAFKRAADADEP